MTIQEKDITDHGAVIGVRELALSAAGAAALRAAVRIGVAEALGDRPRTPAELAAAIGADTEMLGRLLRALAQHGVFTQTEEGYAHTATSRLLREDDPNSLKYYTLWVTEPWTWELWPHLEDAVRNGRGGFEEKYGTDFFSYLHRMWPQSADVFNKAQTELSRLATHAVAAALDLSEVGTLVDVAGGHGFTLATLLEKNPHLSGVLFDLPPVVAEADGRLRAGGELADRARVVGGSCLEEIPVQADAYLFKNILEWADDKSVTALRNAARAGRPDSRFFIITNMIDGSPEIKFTTGTDLLFLLNSDGRKHTTDTITAVVRKADLRVVSMRPVNSYLHLLEAAPST
ncbi:methyltransferase [Streptomyces roseirectus]|uniref:Methyltransferase n=1 Tax=Streptomyces roseirectus TaxID=2768066 RepID=A0A7H0IPG5_9ACTN|nr:methyltransferase [Streptomyces roseirectus]QNP74681.1 methyltransferase [Streptomyces roseirectus]